MGKKMEIIKIGLLGIAAVLLAVQFKTQKPEYSLYIGIGAAVLVFSYTFRFLSQLLSQISTLQEFFDGNGSYLKTLFKIVGITYVCEFSAGICKDAGFSSVAGQIEVMGKLSVMFAGLPILLAVLEQIRNF